MNTKGNKIRVLQILTSPTNAKLLDEAIIKDAESRGIVISKGLKEDILGNELKTYEKLSKEELLKRIQEEKPK